MAVSPTFTLDGKHSQTIVSLPFQVKTESASEDEQDFHQESTEDYQLSNAIKQEVKEEYYSSMEDEVNEEVEVQESGLEIEADKNTFCDDSALVKSENDGPDTDIKEEESMSDDLQQCSRGDKKKQIFQKHIKKLYYANEAGHTCSVCGKVFDKSQKCLWHIWHMHTTDKPYACKLCGKTFVSRYHLQSHKASHSDDCPCSCDICGKAIKTAAALKQHKISHSDERPYLCDVCGKYFKFVTHLKKHRETHLDAKHCCDVCGKMFKTMLALTSHKLYHSVERPYCCDECGMTFKAKIRLQRHKETCDSYERPYSCDVCGKAFRFCIDFKNHKAGHGTTKMVKQKHCKMSQTKEGPLANDLRLEGSESTVKPFDPTKIIFTYSKSTNLCRK